jgi:hypothetical protein
VHPEQVEHQEEYARPTSLRHSGRYAAVLLQPFLDSRLGTVVAAKSTVKVKLPITISRKDPVVIFEYSQKYRFYTGDYFEFDTLGTELAY